MSDGRCAVVAAGGGGVRLLADAAGSGAVPGGVGGVPRGGLRGLGFPEPGPEEKTLVRLGLAVLLLLILRFGGQLLLGLAGLSWRRWVKSALDLGLLGAASVLAAKTAGRLIDDPARRDWQRWCSALWAGLIIFSAVGLAGMKLLWTDLGDRVTQWEGQKAVAEYVGAFHEKVYPYRNLLVRGNEVIYEWWD